MGQRAWRQQVGRGAVARRFRPARTTYDLVRELPQRDKGRIEHEGGDRRVAIGVQQRGGRLAVGEEVEFSVAKNVDSGRVKATAVVASLPYSDGFSRLFDELFEPPSGSTGGQQTTEHYAP